MARVTEYRADPDLADRWSRAAMRRCAGCASRACRSRPIYGRQAFQVDGRFRFWGGLTDRGLRRRPRPGRRACSRRPRRPASTSLYERPGESLIADDAGVHGVRGSRSRRRDERVAAGAVVLAAGGFQANAEWRTRYLGPGWDLAKVRGTRYNTGDGIRMALDIGATPAGHWSGCHAVRLGPATRRSSATSRSATASRSTATRSGSWSTPTASGSSTRAPTSATTPTPSTAGSSWPSRGQFAWQVFDAKVAHLLRAEFYRSRRSPRRPATP